MPNQNKIDVPLEPKPNWFRRHWKWLLVAVLAVLIVSLIGLTLINRPNQRTGSGVIETKTEDCQVKQPLFTAAVTEIEKIEAFGVLGGVVGGSPARSYIGIADKQEVAVYNPGEATLETIVYARRGGPDTPGEYGLYFKTNCNITYLLDHIHSVTDEIRALAPQQPADSSATQHGTNPNKRIPAGQLMGHTRGTPLAGTFDFLVMDRSQKAFHINEERWDWEQAVYGVCPYDLYTDELKAQFYAKLGEPSEGGLTKATSCGGPSQDVAGTASGGWFQGNATTNRGKWLAIGQLFGQAQIALRENSNINFSFRDYNPKVLPEKLTPPNQVCYQGYNNDWVFLKLLSDTQLSFAKGNGNCPASFPESSAEIWER